MIRYVNKNINPKNKKTCDCVIRAIALASDKSYEEVYRELVEISLRTGYFITEKRTYDKYLEKIGFVKMKQPRKGDGTKYIVKEIDELISSSQTVIVSVAHHLTCVKEHICYDLWDCRHKSVGNYYIK